MFVHALIPVLSQHIGYRAKNESTSKIVQIKQQTSRWFNLSCAWNMNSIRKLICICQIIKKRARERTFVRKTT